MLLLEHLRLNRVLGGLLVGLLGAVCDGRYGFDVTALVKGWLTLRRGTPRSTRAQLDYHRLPPSFSAEAGDVLLRTLLDGGPIDLTDFPAVRRIAPREWRC